MSRPRILGGSARGRELKTPASGTRPTPARIREAVFNSLQSASGTFLDLFAGSGAMGLEAASRGWQATSVELAAPAAGIIRDNARRLRLPLTVVEGDALAFSRQERAFDVVFASPPYDLPGFARLYADILAAGPAAPGGLYLFQHPSGLKLSELLRDLLPPGAVLREKRYGSNTLTSVRLPAPQAG